MIRLTSNITLPEDSVRFSRIIAIDGTDGIVNPISLIQYDDTLPIAAITLTFQGMQYKPPSGSTLRVRMKKPDGCEVYNQCLGMDDTGVVYFAFTEQMTAASGNGAWCNIEILTDAGTKYSDRIPIAIEQNATQTKSIVSSDEYLAIDVILTQVKQLQQQTAADAAKVDASKTAAASSATAAQAARQGAEAAESRVNAIVAGNEAWTKQQSNDRFARALKAEVAQAETLEIYPDEGSNVAVTVYGFTEQAGTGDASPANVRKITVGGKKLVKLVLDGNFAWSINLANSIKPNSCAVYLNTGVMSGYGIPAKAFGYSSYLPWSNSPYSTDKPSVYAETVFAVRIAKEKLLKYGYDETSSTGLSACKAYLNANPLPVWFDPTDSTKVTGIYTPEITDGEKYNAFGIPLTAHLCDGDTVETWVKSGCDKEILIDGSQDLAWYANTGAPYGGWFYFNIDDAVKWSSVTENAPIYSDKLTPIPTNQEKAYAGVIFMRSSTGGIAFTLFGQKTVSDAKQYLSENPIKARYRSVNYTYENDIPVCLERHDRVQIALGGDSASGVTDAGLSTQLFRVKVPFPPLSPNTNETPIICDSYKFVRWGSSPWNVDNSISYETANNIRIKDSRFETVEEINANFSALSEKGNPVTVVYKLATPIIYAHDPVYLKAYPDGNGKFVVTGEKTVSAKYNKSINRVFEEISSAVLAMGANLSL